MPEDLALMAPPAAEQLPRDPIQESSILLAKLEGLKNQAVANALEIAQGLEPAGRRAIEMASVAEIDGPNSKIWGKATALVGENMEPSNDRDQAYLQIARGYGRTGNVDGALGVIERINDETHHAAAFEHLGLDLVNSGDLMSAVSLVGQLEDGKPKEKILRSIAEAQAKAGDLTAAFSTLDDTHGWEFSEGIRNIALELAERGQIDDAMHTMSRLGDGDEHDEVLSKAPKGLAKIGQIERALKVSDALAERNKYYDLRNSQHVASRLDIAKVVIDQGKVDEGLKILSETRGLIKEGSGMAEALEKAVSTEIKLGDIEKAKKLASEIIDGWEAKTRAFIEISAAEGKDSPSWLEAERTFKILDNDESRAEHHIKGLRQELVGKWASTGEIEGPLRVAKHKNTDTYDPEMIAVICGAQAKMGNVEQAKKLVFKVADDAYHSRPYHAIALAQAKNGDMAGALLTAEMIHSSNRSDTLLDLAEMQGPDSPIWEQLFTRKTNGPLSLFEARINQKIGERIKKMEEELVPKGAKPAVLQELVDNVQRLRGMKSVGAYAIEQWKEFKDYSPEQFAKLAHGAAEIAHGYMTDDERRAFVRHLADEFRSFRDQGMFDDGKHASVLKNLSEALVDLKDPAAVGDLINTMHEHKGNAVGMRIIKTLIDSGNSRAAAAGINVLCDPKTDSHVYEYLLQKLASKNILDKELPSTIRVQQSISPNSCRTVIQRFYKDLGVQTDTQLLNWVLSKTKTSPGQELSDKEFTTQLDGIMNSVKESIGRFENMNQAELLAALAANADDRTLFFCINGGRTNYSLIHQYNLKKFSDAIAMADSLQQRLDLELVDRELWANAEEGWLGAMIDRRRPSDSLVWQFDVGAAKNEIKASAVQEIRSVFGEQLRWLMAGGQNAENLAGMEDPGQLDPKTEKLLHRVLGETISGLVKGEQQDFSSGDFEKIKNTMIFELRQRRKAAKQQKNPDDTKWDKLISLAESEEAVISLRHSLALLANDPTLSLKDEGAVGEWMSHFAGLADRVRDSQISGADKRKITMRYLDGKEDFAELLRFADGAQCCFTSEDTVGTEQDKSGRYRMSINRDPHWFVFSIEDTEPDAKKRQSSGFVFGSLGRYEGRPALMLNGVYMQRKTDSATNVILDQIGERLAKPLGINQMVVASSFGGESRLDPDKWINAEGKTVYRPRALRAENGQPETQIYDDLGYVVNQDYAASERLWASNVT
jgi:tetratricopeptide (TPR) repeat protein